MDKPGAAVREEVRLEVAAREPFASRAGRKLAAALDHFAPSGVDPAGLVCLDVGASTGGFTDCLLQRGAVRVYAVDVGYGQLDQRLRSDPRVVVMDRINARLLAAAALPERCGLITVDVSFISLLKVVPALLPHLAAEAWLLPMIKPQFEAGRGAVGKGGILRDEAVRQRVIEECAAGIAALGVTRLGLFDSPVAGTGGNREAFALFRRYGRMSRRRNHNGHFQSVGIVAKAGSRDAQDTAQELAEWLRRRGLAATLDETSLRARGRGEETPTMPAGAYDLVVVLGGDGTLLAAARTLQAGIPILGVNLGNLGFLTEINRGELYPALVEVLEGRFSTEERSLFDVELRRQSGTPSRFRVLNDAVITKSALARIIELTLQVDGHLIARFRSRRPHHLDPHRLHGLQPLGRRPDCQSAAAGGRADADLPARTLHAAHRGARRRAHRGHPGDAARGGLPHPRRPGRHLAQLRRHRQPHPQRLDRAAGQGQRPAVLREPAGEAALGRPGGGDGGSRRRRKRRQPVVSEPSEPSEPNGPAEPAPPPVARRPQPSRQGPALGGAPLRLGRSAGGRPPGLGPAPHPEPLRPSAGAGPAGDPRQDLLRAAGSSRSAVSTTPSFRRRWSWRDILLPGPHPGDTPVLRAPYARVELAIHDLNGRVFDLEQIEVVRPEVYIQTNADDTSNLPQFVLPKGGGGKKQLDIRIGHILVQDGIFRLNERHSPLTLDAKAIWARLTGRADRKGEGGNRLDYLATAQEIGLRLPFAKPYKCTASVRGSLDQGKVAVASVRIAGPNLSLLADGVIDYPRRIEIHYTGQGAAQIVNRLGYMTDPDRRARRRARPASIGPMTSGPTRAPPARPHIATFGRTFQDAAATYLGGIKGIDVKIDRARYAGGAVTGQVGVEYSKETREGIPVALNLDVSGLEIQQLIADQFPGQDIPIVGGLVGRAQGKVKYDFGHLAVLTGSGRADLHVQGESTGGLPLEGDLPVVLDHGVISATDLHLVSPGQDITSSGFTYDLTHESGKLDFQLVSQDVSPPQPAPRRPSEARRAAGSLAAHRRAGTAAGTYTFDHADYTLRLSLDLHDAVAPITRADSGPRLP